MVQFPLSIATGCTAYLVMKHLVHVIGPAGMAPQPNNFALAVYSIMKMLTAATGRRMLMAAKSIVCLFSHNQLIFSSLLINIEMPKIELIARFDTALCNDDPNGNVGLGKSCNRYWQCQGGYPRLQRCPAMLVFDRRSLRCVVPPTEDCDIPAAPPSDGESQDGGQQGQQVNKNGKSIYGRAFDGRLTCGLIKIDGF